MVDLASGKPLAPAPEDSARLWRKLRAWHRRSVVAGVDHAAVLTRVHSEGAWSGRYAFMICMSAGIAILGLLLSSPAVIIGAMLISPLMGPIIGLGFALATLDWLEARRSILALVLGSLLAVGFAAAVVLMSPLKDVTPEIAARIRPNLFDLLVAVFSALAGAYATVRGRGETIVGVAIATALMPPLAVVGFGAATANVAVFGGALGLFLTNCFAIALSATFVARFYGFGSQLSPRQSRQQVLALIVVFAVLSVPLVISLRQIAWEAWATRSARTAVQEEFGRVARVATLEPDFSGETIGIRTSVFTEVYRDKASADLSRRLTKRLGRPVTMELSQIVVNQGMVVDELERARAAGLSASNDRLARADVAAQVSLALGIPIEEVLVDPVTRRVTATVPPAMTLTDAMAVEARLHQALSGWRFALRPSPGTLAELRVPDVGSEPGAEDQLRLEALAWAILRSGTNRVVVTPRRLSGEDVADAGERAQRVAEAMAAHGIVADVRLASDADRALELDEGRAAARSVAVTLLPPAEPQLPLATQAEPARREAAV